MLILTNSRYNTDMRKRAHLFLTLIILFSIANVAMWIFLGLQTVSADRIGGLTQAEVIAKLEPTITDLLNQKLTINADSHTYNPTLKDLGYRIDANAMIQSALHKRDLQTLWINVTAFFQPHQIPKLPLVYSVDHDTLATYIDTIEKDVNHDPKDITLDYTQGVLVSIPAESGVTLDRPQTETRLAEINPEHFTVSVTLPIHEITAAINQESQIASARAELDKLIAKPLTIKVEEVSLDLSPETLFSFVILTSQDNQLHVAFDETKVKTTAQDLAKKVDVTPTTRRVQAADSSIITEGRDGRKLNVADATSKIIEHLKAADTASPLVLATEKVDRKVVTETPEYQLGRYEGKYIEVDLSLQRLHLLEGTNHVASYAVSTGKWSTPTPIGEFEIHNHVPTAWSSRYHLYMDNWMAITGDGLYGIHQLPRWPNGYVEGANHIGTPVSHGCIRLAAGDSKAVYDWASNGTKVIIHE